MTHETPRRRTHSRRSRSRSRSSGSRPARSRSSVWISGARPWASQYAIAMSIDARSPANGPTMKVCAQGRYCSVAAASAACSVVRSQLKPISGTGEAARRRTAEASPAGPGRTLSITTPPPRLRARARPAQGLRHDRVVGGRELGDPLRARDRDAGQARERAPRLVAHVEAAHPAAGRERDRREGARARQHRQRRHVPGHLAARAAQLRHVLRHVEAARRDAHAVRPAGGVPLHALAAARERSAPQDGELVVHDVGDPGVHLGQPLGAQAGRERRRGRAAGRKRGAGLGGALPPVRARQERVEAAVGVQPDVEDRRRRHHRAERAQHRGAAARALVAQQRLGGGRAALRVHAVPDGFQQLDVALLVEPRLGRRHARPPASERCTARWLARPSIFSARSSGVMPSDSATTTAAWVRRGAK